MAMEGRICDELTPRYYALCAIGGMLSAGTTHLAITPLDVLKVNMQVHFNFVFTDFFQKLSFLGYPFNM